MAPRANWKGFLRLSLVTCPIALFPATSESEKISFNQINRKTGHRIKYSKVDAETGEEVESSDIMKGYKVDTDTYLEVTKDELENIALEYTRTIDIDQFVPRSEIDDLYLVRPYYVVPDGKVGHDAYAVIRETIRSLDKVALARVALTNREHVIALEARDKGLMGMLCGIPTRCARTRNISMTPGREDHEGNARPRQTYCRDQIWPLRAGQIRRSL
jgi:DNA end-binding protein Ku